VSDHPISEQLSRLIDADLPLTERAAVLDHLATCPTCASSHARLVEAAAALRELPAVAWRPDTPNYSGTISGSALRTNRTGRAATSRVIACGCLMALIREPRCRPCWMQELPPVVESCARIAKPAT